MRHFLLRNENLIDWLLWSFMQKLWGGAVFDSCCTSKLEASDSTGILVSISLSWVCSSQRLWKEISHFGLFQAAVGCNFLCLGLMWGKAATTKKHMTESLAVGGTVTWAVFFKVVSLVILPSAHALFPFTGYSIFTLFSWGVTSPDCFFLRWGRATRGDWSGQNIPFST